MRILVVEDDATLAEGLCRLLRASGHAVDPVRSAEHAESARLVEQYDLIVLDVGLPGMDGFELLRRIRAAGDSCPILMLTARDALVDRVQGLDLGADDYLTKPFELDEFEARVRALLRRSQSQRRATITVGRLEIDLRARRVSLDGKQVELTSREWALLELFLAKPGRALSKSRIVQTLCGFDDAEITQNAVEVYVSRLRAKLEPGGFILRTVRGFGYRWDDVKAAA